MSSRTVSVTVTNDADAAPGCGRRSAFGEARNISGNVVMTANRWGNGIGAATICYTGKLGTPTPNYGMIAVRGRLQCS